MTQPPTPRNAVIDGVVYLVSVDGDVVGEALPWVEREDLPS